MRKAGDPGAGRERDERARVTSDRARRVGLASRRAARRKLRHETLARRRAWTETNTHHEPGIQVVDVAELIDQGAEIIVLSRGMQLVLKTGHETLKRLRALGIAVHLLETRDAVKTYNELATKGLPVGGLFHSTC